MKTYTLKNQIILKFEAFLDYGNGNGYLLAARIYTSRIDNGKMNKEGKNPEGKTTTNLEGAERGATAKWLCCDDKLEKEDGMGDKIVLMRKYKEAKETAAQDNKSSHNTEQKKSITVNVNGKWCSQYKNKNKKIPILKKTYVYDEITYKYLQKI